MGNSKYYNYVVSNNGVAEKHGHDYDKDYFTDRICNKSLEFLGTAISAKKPFLIMLGTPASHGPNEPAPQYAETYAGRLAPRLPSWNKAPQPDKHALLRKIVPMTERHINVSDVFFQRRWSVLRSVDDLVERLVTALTDAGVFDDTYFIYSSDHGYHLGEFGMLYDKRMLYETDIRVPLFVRGPGIAPGQTIQSVASHVDHMPTILDMMGIEKPPQVDGRSWLGIVSGTEKPWTSRTIMVEYSGSGAPELSPKTGLIANEIALESATFWSAANFNATASGGVPCDAQSQSANSEDTIVGKCSCTYGALTGVPIDASPCDGPENTYACIRTISPTENTIYCEFADRFVEYYDLEEDPYNLVNLKNKTDPSVLRKLSADLATQKSCAGADCLKLA